jgi:hypothetical protein
MWERFGEVQRRVQGTAEMEAVHKVFGFERNRDLELDAGRFGIEGGRLFPRCERSGGIAAGFQLLGTRFELRHRFLPAGSSTTGRHQQIGNQRRRMGSIQCGNFFRESSGSRRAAERTSQTVFPLLGCLVYLPGSC